MAINHLESIKMRVYVLLLTCLFFSLLGKPQQPRMMYEDTSRRGVPFSKDPHVVNFQGRYLMYYTLPPRLDVSGSGANIGIASSKDLVNWSKVGEITPEKNAVYEKNGLCAPGALVRDGKIHLFYQTYGMEKMMQSVMLCQLMVSTLIATRVIRFFIRRVIGTVDGLLMLKFVNSMESIFFILQLVTRILKYKCKEWQQLL